MPKLNLADSLWQELRKDIEAFQTKYNNDKYSFFDDFFQVNRWYSCSCPSEEDRETERYSKLIRDAHDELFKYHKEIYQLNHKFTELIHNVHHLSYGGEYNLQDYLAHCLDGFYTYTLPRIVFSKNPHEEYKKIFDNFLSDFLSEKFCFLFFFKFENLYNEKSSIKLDSDNIIDGCSGFKFVNFDSQLAIEKYCFFKEISKYCLEEAKRTYGINVIPEYKSNDVNFFWYFQRELKIDKSKFLKGFNLDTYNQFRKIIFLMRMVCNSLTYFEIMAFRPKYQVNFDLTITSKRFPGHRIDSHGMFNNHPIADWNQIALIDLWNKIKDIDYELLMVPDFKYEYCLKRSESHNPSGYDENYMFNNFDRILDLFQGIENILGAPKNKKYAYIKDLWPVLLYPDKAKAKGRQEEQNRIKFMLDIRHDYAHGELNKLVKQFRQTNESKKLKDETRIFAAKYSELVIFMINNSSLIPTIKPNGDRDNSMLKTFYNNMK